MCTSKGLPKQELRKAGRAVGDTTDPKLFAIWPSHTSTKGQRLCTAAKGSLGHSRGVGVSWDDKTSPMSEQRLHPSIPTKDAKVPFPPGCQPAVISPISVPTFSKSKWEGKTIHIKTVAGTVINYNNPSFPPSVEPRKGETCLGEELSDMVSPGVTQKGLQGVQEHRSHPTLMVSIQHHQLMARGAAFKGSCLIGIRCCIKSSGVDSEYAAPACVKGREQPQRQVSRWWLNPFTSQRINQGNYIYSKQTRPQGKVLIRSFVHSLKK